jgi:6-phosphofructokinase 1
LQASSAQDEALASCSRKLAKQQSIISGKMASAGLSSLAGRDRSSQRANFTSWDSLQSITVPGSIDNDMPGTEITIAADTAINTAVGAIDRLRDTAASDRRGMLVEVMGRKCGYIAVMAGIASDSHPGTSRRA